MVDEKQNSLIVAAETMIANKVDWEKALNLVVELTAKGATPEEFAYFVYMAKKYDLDPLKKEIWCIKGFGGAPAQVFVSRDGLLKLAHKSKQFGSMKTVCELDATTKKPVSATCTIWRKDFDKPFEYTSYFDEYNLNQALWLKKPKMMLMKVAEASCLRRAFSISGLYLQEEFGEEFNGKGIENAKTQE